MYSAAQQRRQIAGTSVPGGLVKPASKAPKGRRHSTRRLTSPPPEFASLLRIWFHGLKARGYLPPPLRGFQHFPLKAVGGRRSTPFRLRKCSQPCLRKSIVRSWNRIRGRNHPGCSSIRDGVFRDHSCKTRDAALTLEGPRSLLADLPNPQRRNFPGSSSHRRRRAIRGRGVLRRADQVCRGVL